MKLSIATVWRFIFRSCVSAPRSVLNFLVASLLLSRLDCGNNTLSSSPLYLLQRFPAARLVFYDSVPPLLHQLHWLEAPETVQYTNSLFWRSSVCTVQRHRTSLTTSSGPRTSRLEVVFTQRHRHHWSSVVHGCRLSTTELLRSPLSPVASPGVPSCLERTAMPCHVCTVPTEFSTVVWQLTFSAVPFPAFSSACEVTVSYRLFLTYLLIWTKLSHDSPKSEQSSSSSSSLFEVVELFFAVASSRTVHCCILRE